MKNKLLVLIVSLVVGLILVFVISLNVLYSSFKNTCPKDHVCIPRKLYNEEKRQEIKDPPKQEIAVQSIDRDRRVLDDPLYPPLNRTDRSTYNGVVRETTARNINIPTNNSFDSYRLIGYITTKDTEKDAGMNSWKLMGRQKDRNEYDFYIVPTNNNYDIKVPLTPEVCVGYRFKDIYSIPKQVQFKSPMLNASYYEFIELPKADFSDPRYN